MIIDQHRAVAIVRPSGTSLAVESVTVTLDEAHAPYGLVELVAKIPEDRSVLDLRGGWRTLELRLLQAFGRTFSLEQVTVLAGGGRLGDLTAEVGGSLGAVTTALSTNWNGSRIDPTRRGMRMLIVGVDFSEETGTVAISAETREAMLIGDVFVGAYATIAPTTSLRLACEWLLRRYGQYLTPGLDDGVIVDPAALVWRPGVTAWEWLNPLLQAASLRLWCDERGTWRLTARESATDGTVTLAADTVLTALTTSVRLDNPDEWADAVVIRYEWTDVDGIRHEAIDAAGAQPSRSAIVIDRKAVYPGPGAAAGILARRQGRGRVMSATARSDYAATPGQVLVVAEETPMVWEPGAVVATQRHMNPRMNPLGGIGVNRTGSNTFTFVTVAGKTWMQFLAISTPVASAYLSPHSRRMGAVAGTLVYAVVELRNGAPGARNYSAQIFSTTGAPTSASLGSALTAYSAPTVNVPAGGVHTFSWSATITDATSQSVHVTALRQSAGGAAAADATQVRVLWLSTDPPPADIDTFDGSDPDDAGPGYAYDWTGPEFASTSTRRELVEVPGTPEQQTGAVAMVRWQLPSAEMQIDSRGMTDA